MATRGNVAREMLNVEIGTLREKYPVATLSGWGAELSVTMNVARPEGSGTSPILLEVQEIHNRRPQTFGYTVQVNGKEAYFRTYNEMAAGPNHYFVQIPATDAREGTLHVTFRSQSDAPFSLGKLWAYGDFARLARDEQTYQPMPVVENATVLLPGLLPKGADGKEDRWKPVDPQIEAKAWEDLKLRLKGTGYGAGIYTDIAYADAPLSEVKKGIDKSLERVGKYGVDLQLAFNGSEWGRHPEGPDGLGGYFSDIKYSKIHFDSIHKDYRPCWPGTPGGRTWPTWNDPQLNRYLAHRLTQAVQYLCDRRAILSARGVKLPPPEIDQEWGLSIDDSNDATIAEAKKDGVTLIPEDGLNPQEKKWVFDNLCRTTARFADAFSKAAGQECVVIDRGEIRMPEQQIRDDYYFQTFADPVGPYFDDQWAGWQFGVGPNSWATGEFLPQLPSAYYDYIMARGKLACPNMERMGLPTLDYLQTVYQRGFRMVTMINTHPGDADKFIPQAAGMDEKRCDPALHCDRKLLSFRFVKGGPLGPDGALVDKTNLKVAGDPMAIAYDRLVVENPANLGVITYRVTNDNPAPDKPVLLNLTCQLAKGHGSISFAVGKTPTELQTVATLTEKDVTPKKYYHWRNFGSVDLGESVRGQRSFILRIIVDSKAPTDATIERFQVVSSWGKPSGHPNGEPFTVKQMRTFHLWFQDRAVYERAAAGYKREQGEDTAFKKAANLAAQGHYRSAYKAISDAWSLALPARFAVRGHGKLGPYPLMLRLPDDEQVALVNLIRVGPTEFELELKSEKALQAQLQIDSLRDGDEYSIEATGQGRYRITPAKPGAAKPLRVAGGHLVAEITAKVADPQRQPLPRRLSGTFQSVAPGGILINTQEPELWLNNPIFVPIASNAKYMRKRFGAETPVTQSWPLPKDQVDIVIDEAGEASEVTSIYGKDNGRIKAFHPPKAKGETSNGIIELENGHSYEFSNMWGWTDVQVPPLKPYVRFNTQEQLVAALTPGKSVEIDFCPYKPNGRLPRMTKISPQK